MALLKRSAGLLLLYAGMCLCPVAVRPEIPIALHEQEIKAGLLYNFLKYTQWPASSERKITLCLLGGEPFAASLRPMAGRTVNQREIALRVLGRGSESEGCHLLFIGAAERERWPELQRRLAGKPVLTVSDMEAFSEEGGMIEFSRRDNRISVTLNSGAVAAAGLKVQDRLLKLMTVVRAPGGHP